MNNPQKIKLNGKCTNYNNCDDVWKFMLEKSEIKGELFKEQLQKCRIVALDSTNNPNSTEEKPVGKQMIKKNKKGGGAGGKKPYKR